MKPSTLKTVALVFFAAMALVACKKGGTASRGSSEDGKTAIDNLVAGVESAIGNKAAFVIRPESHVYVMKDGKLEWLEAVQIGTEVQVTGKAEKAQYQDYDKWDVLPVKLDSGKDGYIIESHLGEGESLGVVVSDLATLYKEPKDTAIMEVILPKMNVVVVSKNESNPEFYRFVGMHSETYVRYDTRYLQAGDVSLAVEDVNTALLLLAARGMKVKEARQKLVGTITSKYPGSAFTDKVQEFQVALDPDRMGTEAVGREFACKNVGIIRDIPSVYGAEVVRLKKGEAAVVDEWTSETFTIGDETARWYKVSSPKPGWIWGGALEEK